jgi:hypothetical protein
MKGKEHRTRRGKGAREKYSQVVTNMLKVQQSLPWIKVCIQQELASIDKELADLLQRHISLPRPSPHEHDPLQ